MSIEKTSEDTSQLRSIIGALAAGNNVLLTGPGGCAKCLDPDTLVLKYDGTVERAYKIKAGDVLVGDDSMPRIVYSTAWGYGKMYKITTNYNDVYVVNDEHILTLKQAYQHVMMKRKKGIYVYYPENEVTIAKVVFKYENHLCAEKAALFFCHHILSHQKPIVLDINIQEYMKQSKIWKSFFHTYKTFVEYPLSPYECGVSDPYFVGIQMNSEITGKDLSYDSYAYIFEIISTSKFTVFEMKDVAKINGITRIPSEIYTTTLSFRRAVVAGIVDELGTYELDDVFNLKSTSEPYLKDVERLCRSIGLTAYTHLPSITSKKYKLTIYGNEFWKDIPSRKFKNILLKTTPILHMKVEDNGIGYYYGFTLNENGRFLLGNYCVTHNTHTLKAIASHFHLAGEEIACTATTGVAALGLTIPELNLSPQTFHSWAGIGLGDRTVRAHVSSISRNPSLDERWRNAKYLIIDEISMMGAELLDKVNEIAKLVRKSVLPFGGIRLILSGDFLQLPPVKDEFAFLAKCWDSFALVPFVFKIPKRYDDLSYFDLLLRVRQGTHTQEDVKKLHARTIAYKKLMGCLGGGNVTAIKPTIMYSTRACVQHYNITELNKLTTPEQKYVAYDEFKPPNTNREAYYKSLLDDALPAEITLKVGAQVMLKANLNLKAGLVNGSRGVVEGLSAYAVTVRFVNGAKVVIVPQTFTVKENKNQATRTQIPLILAWALTIHKSQGVTLDYTICDIGESVFAPGQAYVALSRVRNLKGLFLSKFDYRSINANPKAVKYNNSIENEVTHTPKFIYATILEEHLRKVNQSQTKTNLSVDAWKFWLMDKKDLNFKEWEDVLNMGKKEGYKTDQPEELNEIVNARLGLAKRGIFEKGGWKKWLLENHVDKGGELEECKLVIGYGRVMEWTQ